MKNKKVTRWIMIIGLSCLIASICILLLIGSIRETCLIKRGGLLIVSVESFKKENGRYPISMAELGWEETEAGPLYYQRMDALPNINDSTNYEIWFGIGLGSSYVYQSDVKKWNKHY